MGRLLLMTGGLILFALLAVICVQNRAPAIEDDLTTRIRTVLQKAGFQQIDVSLDGRKVKLGGILSSEASKRRVDELVLYVTGIEDVDNQILVRKAEKSEPILPKVYQTEFSLSDGQLTLSGLVPDQKARSSLLAIAVRLFGKDNIIDQLVIKPGAPDNWIEAAQQVLMQLPAFDDASVQISGTKIQLSGVASSPTSVTHIQTNTTSAFPQNFQSTYDIRVADSVTNKQDQNVISDSILCRERLGEFLSQQSFRFRSDSDVIDADSQRFIDQLIKYLQECPDVKIEIAGYTDSQGSQEYNIKLAKRRANTIASLLIANNISAERLSTVGYGEIKPVASNSSEHGRAKNRRIEFKIVGG